MVIQADMNQTLRGAGRALMLSNYIMETYSKKATPKQAEFLLEMFQTELAYRDENRRLRLKKKAAFPAVKSFEGFDWSYTSLPQTITQDDIVDVAFIARKENILCLGPVGTGKTHLMVACGVRACEMGMKVRFITTAELVLRLMSAKEAGNLEKVLGEFTSYDCLLLDELGYVPIDRDGSRLLFQVISRLYETRSLMLSSNLEFSRWASVLTEEQMASALIDRLLHHGHVITFKGESYRIRHALMNTKGKGGTNGK